MEGSEEGTHSVDDDEAVGLGGGEQTLQRLGDELVAALVQLGVDGAVGLEVDHDAAGPLAVGGHDFPGVDKEAVGGDDAVGFEFLLDGHDGLDHLLAVLTVLDLVGLACFFQKTLLDV